MVYDNLPPIPIPEDAYVNSNDGRVFVYILDADSNKKQKVIGYVTNEDDRLMVTNTFFRDFYPKIWADSYPSEPEKQYELSIGLYALVLSVISDTKLQDALHSSYGQKHANAILDYSMFQIKDKSSATQLYEDTMYSEVLFAKQLYSDSWYSGFFKTAVGPDDHYLFRTLWMKEIAGRGVKSVWLCIDGSNNDCQLSDGDMAESGKAKSHNTNKKIVGYMFAISATDGRPVTYIDYEGSVPDSKAFQTMATFLSGYGINVEGVILDRGFPTENVLQTIEHFKWKYVVMLPQDNHGHQCMMKEHGNEIRWRSMYLVGEEGLFGAADVKRLFTTHDRTSRICLYFDGVSGSKQSVKLNRAIIAEKKRIEDAFASGKKNISAANGLKKYLNVDNKQRTVEPRYAEWDRAMSAKGFYSIAVSEGITPEQADRLYGLRSYSESVYSILKSQEGNDTTRVHSEKGLKSKIAISFITTIIRTEILIKCRGLGLDTNVMLKKLDRIKLLLMGNGTYNFVKNLTRQQTDLFEAYGINNDSFYEYARQVNKRLEKKGYKGMVTHKVATKATASSIKNSHVRGGNRRQSTVVVKEHVEVSAPKNKGGRPKGSKDTKPRKGRSDKGLKRGSYKKTKN